jgi:hypothetical protein
MLLLAVLLFGGLLAEIVCNHLNVHASYDPNGHWTFPGTFPTLGERGSDLQILANGARQITHGANPYGGAVAYPPPPFAAAFFYPFTLLNERTAFVVQYWTLMVFNLAAITLLAFCLYRTAAPADGGMPAMVLAALVTGVACVGQFMSYGLEFALERGNFDSYVLLLSAVALTSMVLKPERIWLPVLLLSAAAHLKIYPAILLLLPLLQSWRRAVPLLVVINVAMLGFFGTDMARAFLDQIVHYANAPYIWPGNHSIYAYVNLVVAPAWPESAAAVQSWAVRGIAVVVALVWLHGVLRVRKVLPPARRWLIIAALSFPVMGAMSSTSHDYKLVIYAFPLVVNLYLFGEGFLARGSWANVAGLGLTLVSAVALHHSTTIAALPFQETKFPALCLLQLTTYLLTFVYACEPPADSSHRSRLAPLLPWALAAAAVVIAAASHLELKSRAQAIAREIAAKRAAEPPPKPRPDLAVPAADGYGEIRLRLKLPGTAAAIPEPIFSCGVPGNASLVYVRHLPGAQLKVGVEFWSYRAFESEAFAVPAPDATITVSLSLPCLYANIGDPAWHGMPELIQRELHGRYSIKIDGVERLGGPLEYRQPARATRYYGLNPIGGSLVSAAYTGRVESVEQVAP